MNPTAIVILFTVVTVYFLILLFILLAVPSRICHHLDKTVLLIREQRNEDLRWHRDSLLAHMRADQASKS